MSDERCWDHPDHVATVARMRGEIEAQQVRNADLVEQMAALRDRTGLPGLQGLLHEMRSFGLGQAAYWADRVEALARGDEPTPRTPEEKVAFRKEWDARVDTGRTEQERGVRG